jgi:tetratricopeptide (TPR) repeat protein
MFGQLLDRARLLGLRARQWSVRQLGITTADADISAKHQEALEAYHRHEFERALERWEFLRQRYPKQYLGLWGMGEALREMKRFNAAEEALMQGMQAFPDVEQMFVGFSWVAAHRRDWPTTEKRFRETLSQFPDSLIARFGVGLALTEQGRLDEAEAVLTEGDSHKTHVLTMQQLANIATKSRQFSVAIERWRTVLTLQSDEADNHFKLAGALFSDGRVDEAENVLGDARNRFPADVTVLCRLAQFAQVAGNWAMALHRWEGVMTEFPSRSEGFVGAGAALRALGRLQDAETLLKPAVRIFSRDVALLSLFAQIATHARRWGDARQRWQVVKALAPDEPEGHLGEIAVVRNSGDEPTAETLIEEARAQFPNNLPTACEYARCPQFRRDWEEAGARWQNVARQFPQAVQPKRSWRTTF